MRYVFYTVRFEDRETQLLEELDKVIRSINPPLPSWWVDGDTLRYLYEYDWDFNDAASKI